MSSNVADTLDSPIMHFRCCDEHISSQMTSIMIVRKPRTHAEHGEGSEKLTIFDSMPSGEQKVTQQND